MTAALKKVMIHPRSKETVMDGSVSDPESQRHDERLSRRTSSTGGTMTRSRKQIHGSSSVSSVLRRGKRRSDGDAAAFADSLYSSALNSKPQQARLISRGRGSHPNTVMAGRMLQNRWYLWLWFHLIDTPWLNLLVYYLATFLIFHFIFAIIFYYSNGIIDTAAENNGRKHVSFFDCIYFTNQSMDTIGYGGLQPRTHLTNWIVFIASWTSNLYWVVITGLSLAKFQKPSRLKRTIVFSEVACINTQTAKRFERHVAFSAENAYEQGRYAHGLRKRTKSGRVLGGSGASLTPYFNDVNALYAPPAVPRNHLSDNQSFPSVSFNDGIATSLDSSNSNPLFSDSTPFKEGACLVFRFAHIRPCSRLCETAFNLLLFERSTIGSDDTSSSVQWHTGPMRGDLYPTTTTDTNSNPPTPRRNHLIRDAGSVIQPSSGIDSDTSGAGAVRDTATDSDVIHPRGSSQLGRRMNGADADAEYDSAEEDESDDANDNDGDSGDDESSEDWFNGFEDFRICEMAFELNEQYDRVRSMSMSLPLLTLPWTVTHCIDKYSPLYGLSIDDMNARKMEIIAVLDGIDESSSENFQVWYSYVGSELRINHEFVPMTKAKMVDCKSVYYRDWYANVNDVPIVHPNHPNAQDFLFVDLDRISQTRHIKKISRSKRNNNRHQKRKKKKHMFGGIKSSQSPSVRQGLLRQL